MYRSGMAVSSIVMCHIYLVSAKHRCKKASGLSIPSNPAQRQNRLAALFSMGRPCSTGHIACGGKNGTTDATAGRQGAVGRVDNGVHGHFRDVVAHNFKRYEEVSFRINLPMMLL